MTASGAVRVPLSKLTLGNRLGDGGQGTVWTVENQLINGQWPVAYKEYKADVLRQLREDSLERMVAFLPSRTAQEGQWLAQNTAWPAALVTEGADVRGFLMRQIPDEYFITVKGSGRKPAGFEFLLNPHAYLRNVVGVVPTPRQLFGLLLALADVLGRMHDLGVVAGDLSPKNLLFSLSGRPGCFLIDCDAMGLAGEWALRPVQTPEWDLPGNEWPETQQGDCYKFALLAVRLFLHEQQGSDPAALRKADLAVGDLAARGLSAVPADRPALSEWLDPLRHAVDSAPDTWPQPPPSPSPSPSPSPPRQSPAGTAGTVGATVTVGTTGTRTGTQAGPRAAGVHRGSARPGSAGPGRTQTGGTPPARGSGAPRSGAMRAVSAVLWIVLGIGAWQVVSALVSDGDGRPGGSGGGGGVTKQTEPTQTAPASDARQEEARVLNALLDENNGRRGGVAEAAQALQKCSGLGDAREVFENAAQARAALVGRLEGLELGRLPDGMTSDLRRAWRSSEEADRAYVRAVDEVSGNCTSRRVVSSGGWQDAAVAGERATASKKAFVAAWNPVAEEYGLSTLAWTDL